MTDQTALPKSSADLTYNIMEEALPIFALINSRPFLAPGLDDTTVVLLATGLIEKVLRTSLISIFRRDAVSKTMISSIFEGKGPLATFSAKIEVCAGLGSVSADARHDLKVINKIRNEFAHSPQELHLKDFTSCLSLRMKSKLKIQDDCTQRAMFKQSCTSVIGHLGFGTIFGIASARFLANNSDGVKNEYEALLRSIDTEDEPT
jgi:DNA-binding MltR family transcriptional regulator